MLESLKKFVREVLLEATYRVDTSGEFPKLVLDPEGRRGVGADPKGYVEKEGSKVLDPYTKTETIDNFKINPNSPKPPKSIPLEITAFLDYNYLAGKTARETEANREIYQKYMQDIKTHAKNWLDSPNPDPEFTELIRKAGEEVAKYYSSKGNDYRINRILYPESSSYLAKQFGRSIANSLNAIYRPVDVNKDGAKFEYDISYLRKSAASLDVNLLAIKSAVETKARTGTLKRSPAEEEEHMIKLAKMAISRARRVGFEAKKEYEIKKIPSLLRDFVEGGHEFNKEVDALEGGNFLRGEIVLLVDDNVATGWTFKEIAKLCYRRGAKKVLGSALWKWSDKIYPGQREAPELGWQPPISGEIIESGGARELLFSFLGVGSIVDFYEIKTAGVVEKLRNKKEPGWREKNKKEEDKFEKDNDYQMVSYTPEVSEEEIVEEMKRMISGLQPAARLEKRNMVKNDGTSAAAWFNVEDGSKANFARLQGIFKVNKANESREEKRKIEKQNRLNKAKKEIQDRESLSDIIFKEKMEEVEIAIEELQALQDKAGKTQFTGSELLNKLREIAPDGYSPWQLDYVRAAFGLPSMEASLKDIRAKELAAKADLMGESRRIRSILRKIKNIV